MSGRRLLLRNKQHSSSSLLSSHMEVFQRSRSNKGSFDPAQLDDEWSEPDSHRKDSINPFCIVILIIFLSLLLASMLAYNSSNKTVAATNDFENPQTQLKHFLMSEVKNEPKTGKIQYELDLINSKNIYSSKLLEVKESKTKSFGSVRSLIFTSSNGIEGITPVLCNEESACQANWKAFNRPPLDYIESLSLVVLFGFPDSSCPNDANHHILQIGLGAGSLASFFHEFTPDWQQDIAEISTEVIQLAPLFGVVEDESLHLIASDACGFIDRKCTNQYDVVILDVYDQFDYLPSCITNPLELSKLKNCLTTQGRVVMNLALSGQSNVEEHQVNIINAYKQHFEFVYLLESTKANKILVAHNYPGKMTHQQLVVRTESLPEKCGLPQLTRGRGYFIDATHSTDEKLLEWCSVYNHDIRGCTGFDCLF